MQDKNLDRKHEGFWASVLKDNQSVRDVTYAESYDMAKTLLLSNYTLALKAEVEVIPVVVIPLSEYQEKD
ncbi:hypothetical protein [Neptuniibacter sp. QD37_11]|uniref:hypothetical protein n=1 Tax=Neptuniibacter sp. QD37_11 TaxID=3398209 RepID=UPI0039F48239